MTPSLRHNGETLSFFIPRVIAIFLKQAAIGPVVDRCFHNSDSSKDFSVNTVGLLQRRMERKRGQKDGSHVGRHQPHLSRPSTVRRNASQTESPIKIPVTCYELIGVPDKAEKDKIVKSVMALKQKEKRILKKVTPWMLYLARRSSNGR